MKISEVIAQIRTFTDYIQAIRGTEDVDRKTRWDYHLSVYGPVPGLWPRGDMRRLLDPLQAAAIGWDECHDWSLWVSRRPGEADVRQALDLSKEVYDKIDKALHLVPGYHRQLRADLIAACGLPSEAGTNYFEGKT